MDTTTHTTAAPNLLVVEDDDALAALLTEYLGQHGFAITRVASGTEGAQRILETRPDLVVLDLMLPGMNGLDVCRRVRDDFDGAIVMLTASQSEVDHVTGLELGADDFVVKPIEPRVLLARLRTQLRRVRGAQSAKSAGPPGIVRVGTLEIDVSSRDARIGGDLLPLTTMEFDVLRMLAENAGEVLDRDRLYREVMEMDYDGLDRGMDVHVSRIRRKLKQAGFDTSKLKSVRGVGYLLAPR